MRQAKGKDKIQLETTREKVGGEGEYLGWRLSFTEGISGGQDP